MLNIHIETRLLGRTGTAVTNFDASLPKPHSDLARGSLKDPYRLDFLGLGKEAGEREIENACTFQRFLKLTAARTGQMLNMQSLASDAGISDKTVKHWLSVLETCYLVHFVRPHFANFGKRLTKSLKYGAGQSTARRPQEHGCR